VSGHHPLSRLTAREEDLRMRCMQQAILLHQKTSGIKTRDIIQSADLLYMWVTTGEQTVRATP
jgi:hypothetical protein